ncbi:hypothetical protein CDAR_316441 [Caerostris darwini]|uniref:Uncharacterized protein n=1 Tax=Caerostris darwini TaxID=1538125 RepID=A0AAV4UKS7_9ARAC|nr:hypothetical protein CDAR_316441 [Caerostris darwini]
MKHSLSPFHLSHPTKKKHGEEQKRVEGWKGGVMRELSKAKIGVEDFVEAFSQTSLQSIVWANHRWRRFRKETVVRSSLAKPWRSPSTLDVEVATD